MNKYLIKLADHLDKKGLHKEADYVDWIIKQAQESALKTNSSYDGGFDPERSKRELFNLDYVVSSDIGIDSDSYKKLFPSGMSGMPNSKKTIELSKQVAPFSNYKNLILKVLKMKGEDKNNLNESWCIYGVISTRKDKAEITYDLELNTFSCNELWVYLPHSATPYAVQANRKARRLNG